MVMSPYLSVAVVLAVGLAGVGVLFLVARRASGARKPVEVLPFGAGLDLQEHALSRFHARWYPMTLVFLAFDVEMVFMYPWSVVAADLGAGAIIEMFAFLAVLMAGVVWAWREGAFRWV